MLKQLDSEIVVIVSETWIIEEQSLNTNLSAEQNFMHKNRSHQRWAAEGGGVGIWIPQKKSFKRRRQFGLADPNFLKCYGVN